jgi:hypothetical protein
LYGLDILPTCLMILDVPVLNVKKVLFFIN